MAEEETCGVRCRRAQTLVLGAERSAGGSRVSRLISQRRADHHHADPPGDPLVLDDEDLAALAVRTAAGGVVAAPGDGPGRVHAEVAALLHCGDVPQPLERGG